MQVSVITPVYNAASFVTRAVESALQQPETAEVLLIEDGSPDNALEICQKLAEKYDKVKLLRHPNGENRGAGASRNLGMRNSSFEYIAFLDADDFFLPDRFSMAKTIFQSNSDCEGVYESVGIHMEDDIGLQRWINAKGSVNKLTGLRRIIKPEHLGLILISGEYGSLTLDGLVLKRSVLDKSGYMVEELRLHQDTEFIIRTALVAKLLPARLNEPIAMRGVHDHNRSTAPHSDVEKLDRQLLMWTQLYTWCKQKEYGEPSEKIISLMVINIINKKRFGAVVISKFRAKASFTAWSILYLVAYASEVYF